MLQRHIICSSVHCRMTIKSYLIDNTNFLGKRWCLAFSMYYLNVLYVSNVAWPCCACLYLRNVLLYRYDAGASQNCANLTRDRFFLVSREKKRVPKFVYFLETTMYECLIFWTSMTVCITLTVNSALFRL